MPSVLSISLSLLFLSWKSLACSPFTHEEFYTPYQTEERTISVPIGHITYNPPIRAQQIPPNGYSFHDELIETYSEAYGISLAEVVSTEGNFRHVFRSHNFPGKVVKIYRLNAGIDQNTIKRLIQREVALFILLQQLGFSLATIDLNPDYLNQGIIIQDEIYGDELHTLIDKDHYAYKGNQLPTLAQKAEGVERQMELHQIALLDWLKENNLPFFKIGSKEVGVDFKGDNVLCSQEGCILIDW